MNSDLPTRATKDREEAQRAKMRAHFADRPPSSVSADFDLPAPNDVSAVSQEDGEVNIAAARAMLESKWDAEGDCRSCGWHACLCEHEVEDEDIYDALRKNGGVLELSCVSKDADEPSSHRGVKINIAANAT